MNAPMEVVAHQACSILCQGLCTGLDQPVAIGGNVVVPGNGEAFEMSSARREQVEVLPVND
jgi:hypothetical protein